MRHQLIEAICVNCVAAVKHGYALSGVEQVFAAHGTVLMHAVHNTHMNLLHVDVIAAVALLAMKVILPATHSTDTTMFAVELLLAEIVIKKVAFQARVLPKSRFALHARFPHGLTSGTHRADHLGHRLPVQGVPIGAIGLASCVLLVVAMPAPIRFAATRRHQLATSPVMLASIFLLLVCGAAGVRSVRNGTLVVLDHAYVRMVHTGS